MDNLDQFWEDLLSQDPARIRHAWGELNDQEAAAVVAHLQRMATEEGWQPEQQAAAAAALRTIRDTAG